MATNQRGHTIQCGLRLTNCSTNVEHAECQNNKGVSPSGAERDVEWTNVIFTNLGPMLINVISIGQHGLQHIGNICMILSHWDYRYIL
jgi:hypothetical protein